MLFRSRTEIGNPETVTVSNTSTSTTNATAYVVRTSNTEAFIISVNTSSAIFGSSMNLVGSSTGTTARIIGYDHYSGRASSATANTVILAVDAYLANNTTDYVGKPIYIVAGTGAGQKSTITA